LSEHRTAFVFPAFTSDYADHPGRNMSGFAKHFEELLHEASVLSDPGLAGFDFNGATFPDDELRTQYLTFIYSCAAASTLREQGTVPFLSAGYSMGIYAALVDAGSISFGTGLKLIEIAYRCLKESLHGRNFGMGALIGLDRKDIQNIIDHDTLRVEITNQNASHSFVVSGFREDIRRLMLLATEEGALHTRDLSVSVPYHSGHLEEGAMDFARRTGHLETGPTKTPVISLIDQVFLSSPEIIRRELTRNLYHPLNWLETMKVMLENDIIEFIECGASKGLVKNARFIEGEYRFNTLNSPARL